MEYVDAPTAAEADAAKRAEEAKIAAIQREAARQMFIREHHDCISPWLFSNRERVKRSIARALKHQGEAKLRESQEAK